MKKKILLLVPSLLGLFLSACGGDSPATSQANESKIDSATPSTSESKVDSEETKLDFMNVSFESASFTYDAKPHILPEVSGAPAGTLITYTGRKEYTDAGSYPATALLSKEGYNDKTLSATLIINKGTITGYTFENKSVTYDGKEHINDVQLVGVLPEGTSISTSVKNSSGTTVTSAIEVGTYNYTCTITNKNYNMITLTASLTIKAKKTDMPVFASSEGKIYFANGLHNSYLYSYNYNSSNDSKKWELIDYSSPKEFDKANSSTAIFIANSLWENAVKEIKNGGTSILYTDGNIDDFAKLSDNVYYYSCNSFSSSKSGIYKVDASNQNDEPVITKVFEGKSDNLTTYNGDLYFTNGNDHNYLYKLNTGTNAISLVMEEKVHEYVINGNNLYCTVNGLVNDYIGCLNLASSSKKPTKLTDAAGEFLTIRNGYLYYNYTDLFSYVDPTLKGIWRISLNGGDPSQIIANEGVNGFDVDSSNSIVYIDSTDLHLYKYVISDKTKTDLLAGFTVPEVTPTNLGGRTISLGTKTYYLNMYAGKTLYMYDESTKMSSQLTTNKVEDFYIYSGILYYNQVTNLTNNDLYSINLSTGGEATKTSTNDVRNMVSDGTYIYATHYNFFGVAGGISRMKLDGTEYQKFSEVNGAKDLTIKDGKLYYINCATGQDNGYIEYVKLSDITSNSEKMEGTRLSDNIKNVKQFSFDGNDLFYIYNGVIDNSVRRTDLASLGEGTKIASKKTNPNEILLNGEYVYYYSYPATAVESAGFYRVKKNAAKDETQELILSCNNTYYGNDLSISDAGYLYFMNYIPKILLGNAHFYQLKLSSKTIAKIN